MATEFSIGIDLGGTKILAAIVNEKTGEIIAEVKNKTKKEPPVGAGGSVTVQVIAFSAILHRVSYPIEWYPCYHSKVQSRHNLYTSR